MKKFSNFQLYLFIAVFSLFGFLQMYASDIAVVTLAVGDQYQKVVQPGIDNKRDYCHEHGYDFICATESLDKSRPVAWSKILLVQKALENPSYKWVFWSDAESLITNKALTVEDIIDEKYCFIISFDKVSNSVNSGQFLIKNCPEAKEFLNRVYAHKEFIQQVQGENQAIVAELKSDQNLQKNTKQLAQRLLNSYPSTPLHGMEIDFQSGDFIVHFADCQDLKELSALFALYASKVINSRKALSLDSFLQAYGFDLNQDHPNVSLEGYMTIKQKADFNEALKKYDHIKTIAEIGLNAGHSLLNFIENCPELEKIVSFDINYHPYTAIAVQYFNRFYKNLFFFVEGDSTVKVPEFATQFPKQKFDLIYIDGNHTYDYLKSDVINCKKLAHQETVLWIDDYYGEVKRCLDDLVKRRIIAITSIHQCPDAKHNRIWVEAKYLKIR